ncbi:GNAT family N-acetyltransferase [Catellatospora sp. NPDC049609]|uniref:GNAT family N-acetyltransferase n=1 Tax=Catellatospora sp. NPDC049609 TaxID=3155505 RepID=UPI0034309D6F
MIIRAVADKDHDGVHAILASDQVIQGSMRVPFAPLWQTKERLTSRRGVHQVVAETEGMVIGFCELITYPDEPRHRHVAELNLLATHPDWCNRGVGRTLALKMIDLAESWMNISRISLVVFVDNDHAIKLYTSLGFSIEGTMRGYAYRAGSCIDAHVMARVR